MKHTKGEWFVAIDNNVYSQHGDARIAIVEADFNISEQEAEANARLIAAAPDLFEACEMLIRAIHGDFTTYKSAAYEAGKLAIKKAKGE